MNKTREKLSNANKYCHIYTDVGGITNIHNTETNETYRIIPQISALGFHLERYKDSVLVARNNISFDELKILTDLTGSNHLLKNIGTGGEQTKNSVDVLSTTNFINKLLNDIHNIDPELSEKRQNEFNKLD